MGAMSAESRAGTAGLVGGRLCLDFANTVDWHASAHPDEFLLSYADLLAWSVHAGALASHQADRLREFALRRPASAAAALRHAVVLREAIYRLFGHRARGQPIPSADLAHLNHVLRAARAHHHLVAGAGVLTWEWTDRDANLEAMLWPVAESAASLLTDPELARVRECDGERCGWLFLDTSKGGRRRWCSMDSCGNRAKARRHYSRCHSE